MTGQVTYRTTVTMPDGIRTFFQKISEVAYTVEVDGDRGEVVIDIMQDSHDEYELATTVRDLQQELQAIGFMDYISIERPELVAD